MRNNALPIIPDTQELRITVTKDGMQDMTTVPGDIGKSRRYGLKTNIKKDGIRAITPPGVTGRMAGMNESLFKKVTGRHKGYG